mgnify:CR=1 FL=1
MKKLRKPLSLLLTLTMVLSLFCGMSTVAHAAALDVKIYDQDGISISLSRENKPLIEKNVKFTVIIDGNTVLSEKNVSGVALTANNLSVEAEGYTVTYEGEHTTVAAGTLTLNANLDDEYSVIINLASEKKQDAILIADDTTEYGTFHWQKNNAGNTAFRRNVTVYVNDVETYTQTVNTPKDLSNGGTNNQYWFTPNAQEFKSEYSMKPPYSLGQVTNRDLSIYLTTKCGCGRTTCLCEGGCTCEKDCTCSACMGTNLGDHQINTGYGIIDYKDPVLGGKGYRFTVEVYVNGQKEFTSRELRIPGSWSGAVKFTPKGGYFYHEPNGYDLDTAMSTSSWDYLTGTVTFGGALEADREYDNILRIYLWTFENDVLLDVERRPWDNASEVTGYLISYDAYDPATNTVKTYTYEATSFLAAQAQHVPLGTEVTLTAICPEGKEVTKWSTAEGYLNAEFDGINGGNGSTEAYGNTAYLTVNQTTEKRILVYIEGIQNVVPPTDEDLKALLNGEISVVCTADENHTKADYDLDLGTVTRPTGVTGNALNKYAYELTIKSDSYVKQYNQTVGKDHTPASETKTVTLEYDGKSWTVQAGDTPAEFKVACSTIPDPAYTLTYDANGGYWGTASDTTRTETDLPTPDETDGWHTLSYSDAETAPTHDPVNETDILFVGWTLDQYKRDILDKDATEDDVPKLSTSINMNRDYKVYAVWAEDSNGNDVPDYQEEAITVNFNLKDGTTTDTTSFTLKPFPEKTDIKFGTAPTVTPPTGQEFVNWTLQSDPTESLGDKAYFTYKTIFEMTGGKKTTVTFEANYRSSNAITVTFKVVHGTWSNGSSSNIEVTVPKDGSLTTSQIPTGMKPDPGYKKTGSWDTTPNTTRKLNSNVTYTYTFTKSGDTEPEDEDCILYFESNGGTEFKKIDNGNDSFRINPYSDSEYGQHIPSRPGYRFTGWYRDEDLENRISESTKININSIMTIYAGWERTSVPSMLNGDDHYAYIQGYADGTVRPNAKITRAQVATIFFRLLDEDVRSDYLTTYNTFPDVNADYWANTAISTMASLGVINGRNSGLFDPDAYITRAEFAAICARFDDSNVSGFDSFTDTFGHWAEEEIGRAAALGWIQGYDDGTFRPNQYITRAQAVTMINRVLCRLPEDEDDLLPGMSVWTDCREGDWCYLAIQEATNSHDYVTKDRVYETWTDLNRAPDWSRYE